ncbi:MULTISPECIES: CNNM domain-containing protein [unclassified Haladaptatus]|uniref:CNNM domain-containing protein n=1 Tax=unclassified Haladaptatus TaxID=2622732 RepID=UPI0023E7DD9E|nr:MULTISPECIES: CNNM domain-containing protein [unclassified Haladaptatus]
MSEVVTAFRLLGGVLLLLANAFFVTTEFSLTRVRQFSREEFSGAGLDRAWEMTDKLEIYLSGCQVGITISSVGLGVVAEPAVAAVMSGALGLVGLTSGGHTALSVVLALGLINIAHIVVGEQAPTYLGVERTKFVAKYCAPVLYWWTKVMAPVIILSDKIAKAILRLFGVEIDRSWTEGEEGDGPSTRRELRSRVGDMLDEGDLTEERRDEVINALEIGMTPVHEVMVPREEMVTLSTANTVEENLDIVANQPHGRFPLVGETPEEFLGIVYVPALLQDVEAVMDGSVTLESVAAPPMTVDGRTSVSEVIDEFQEANQELALVTEVPDSAADVDDVTGSVVGLVTATDAFEAITGDLEDPLDREATS